MSKKKETTVIEYTDEMTAQCTVEKFGAVNQKGGYLSVGIKIPIVSNDTAGASSMAGMIATHLGNVAEVTLKFSKAKITTDDGDKNQGRLGLDGLGEGEEPHGDD